ncbi:hypothetical protein P3T36_002236 [Kitasatospora sp. MAP12-15]|uniref:hypothetical protein n=1 Tax=unclassified Kitasatospora TaxID=2633591 RepID=UPI0024752025|nr:hypothetical protein [Kitasatospora sp. MAP12-44]MDH6108884.1 hypothetical protein [Kitasatospora sp. MAP12-44]
MNRIAKLAAVASSIAFAATLALPASAQAASNGGCDIINSYGGNAGRIHFTCYTATARRLDINVKCSTPALPWVGDYAIGYRDPSAYAGNHNGILNCHLPMEYAGGINWNFF